MRTTGQTGVEMEALTAVSVAALTIYDMCKAVERGMRISDIRLVQKSGGRSGDITLGIADACLACSVRRSARTWAAANSSSQLGLRSCLACELLERKADFGQNIGGARKGPAHRRNIGRMDARGIAVIAVAKATAGHLIQFLCQLRSERSGGAMGSTSTSTPVWLGCRMLLLRCSEIERP